MGMLRSVATLQEIITPTTLAFLVDALFVNGGTFVIVEERTEMLASARVLGSARLDKVARQNQRTREGKRRDLVIFDSRRGSRDRK